MLSFEIIFPFLLLLGRLPVHREALRYIKGEIAQTLNITILWRDTSHRFKGLHFKSAQQINSRWTFKYFTEIFLFQACKNFLMQTHLESSLPAHKTMGSSITLCPTALNSYTPLQAHHPISSHPISYLLQTKWPNKFTRDGTIQQDYLRGII